MRFRPPPSAPGIPRLARGALGPRERGARRLRPQAPHRDPRDHQFVGGPRRGGKGAGSSVGELALGLVEAPDQEQAPDLEIARMRGVHPVAVRFERRPRRVERFRGPARSREASAISASATTHRARATASFGPKARAALPQQSLRADEIAELRHRDAAQRERRRVVAQRDPVQRAERITRRERARRGRDQRVHRESRHTCHSRRFRRPALIYRMSDQSPTCTERKEKKR